jgi:hypothetical protein
MENNRVYSVDDAIDTFPCHLWGEISLSDDINFCGWNDVCIEQKVVEFKVADMSNFKDLVSFIARVNSDFSFKAYQTAYMNQIY